MVRDKTRNEPKENVTKQAGRAGKVVRSIFAVLGLLVLFTSAAFGWILMDQNQKLAAEAMNDISQEEQPGEGDAPSGEETQPADKIEIKVPESVRAARIKPGKDYFTDLDADTEALQKEADELFKLLKKYGMKTLFVDLLADGKAVFTAESLKSAYKADLLKLLVATAAKEEVAVYGVFSPQKLCDTQDKVWEYPLMTAPDLLENTLMNLATGYELAGIEIADCAVEKSGTLFAAYVKSGSTASFSKYLRSVSRGTADYVRQILKMYKPSLQVGASVSAVWRNGTDNKGSNTKAEYESYSDGYYDTKALAESGAFDFINVSIPHSTTSGSVPFETAVKWWGALCKEQALPMFVTHAGEYAGKEFKGTDEYARQVSLSIKSGKYHGSVFTGLKNLASDPGGCMTLLIKYYSNEYEEEELFKDLTITVPTQKNITTYEESIQFRGKFDSTQEVKLNGKAIVPTEKGGFNLWIPLNVGKNTITLEHKGRSITYNVERKIVVIKSVSPTSAMEVVGGTKIEVSAVAYKGSTVTATLNGKTITLKESGSGEGDNTQDSLYVNYRGTFTCPAAKEKAQSLGKVSFYATYKGYSGSRSGASVTVAALPPPPPPPEESEEESGETGEESGTTTPGGSTEKHAVITANYAETYPYLSTMTYPEGVLYTLPKGTLDVVESVNGNYLNLRSGKTIKASDATIKNLAFGGDNTISSMTASVSGGDTVVQVKLGWKAPFSLTLSPGPEDETDMGSGYSFKATTLTLMLDYASSASNIAMDLSSSGVFSSYKAERVYDSTHKMYRYKVTFTLRKAGSYYGCYSEYSGNTLVLKFHNPPASGSLSGVTVCVDAGHGGSDPGALGADTTEKAVNLSQTEKIAAELKKRGATVIMTRSGDSYISLQQRVIQADASKVDLFISVHHNSSGSNAKPYGFQTYYNNPFSQPLASAIQSKVNAVHTPSNWSKYDHYNFYVTRSKFRPSVLLECGFMSNPEDEKLAMSEEHQQKIAEAVADGVVAYYS